MKWETFTNKTSPNMPCDGSYVTCREMKKGGSRSSVRPQDTECVRDILMLDTSVFFPSLHQSLEQSSTMNYQVSLWAHFSTMAPNRASKLENLGLPGTHPVQYPDDGWHQGSRPNQTLQGVEEGKLLSE